MGCGIRGGGRANIVAFDHLYATQGGDCLGVSGNGKGPRVKWAYNTSATVTSGTSPILSLDGTKVAWVESDASGAVLEILKWKEDGGAGVVGPDTLLSAGQTWEANCPVGNSCYRRIFLSGTPQATNSAPFPVYSGNNATLYVGDDNGHLHKFINVFSGAPSEVTTSPWPIAVNGTQNLTSPIYDFGSGNIYVGDDGGRLSCVREVGSTVNCGCATPPCLGTTNAALGGAIVSPPIVDSFTQRVFGFEGTDSTNHGRVYQYDTALSAGSQRIVDIGPPNIGTFTQSDIYAGAFDDAYFTGAAGTGHLFVCGKDQDNNRGNSPAMFRIGFAASGLMNTTRRRAAAAHQRERRGLLSGDGVQERRDRPDLLQRRRSSEHGPDARTAPRSAA